jgi:thymidylate synthase
MLVLRKAIKSLHARKDLAYGGSWKRRGERISVIPNLARKVDRLTTYVENSSVMADEHILDTALDLYVYGIKYLLLLAESNPSLEAELPLVTAVHPLSDNEGNFDQLVDAGKYEANHYAPIDTIIAQISSLFEELWPCVESGGGLDVRFSLAKKLADVTELLVMQIAHDFPGAVEAFTHHELPSIEMRTDAHVKDLQA